MEYSCQTYELKCNECGRLLTAIAPSPDARTASPPSKSTYDLAAHPAPQGPVHQSQSIQAGPHNIWRYAALLPIPEGFPTRPPRRLHAAPHRARQKSRQAYRSRRTSSSKTTPSASPRSPSRIASSPSPSPTRRSSASPPSAAASTGNLANSVAAQAARLGLDA